jgi:hypothetical protein
VSYGPIYSDEGNRRRDALMFAVDVFKDCRVGAGARDTRPQQIVDAAKAFDAFLGSQQPGARQEGDPEPHAFVNDGAYTCTVCEEGAPARWHLPESGGAA